MNKRVLFVSSGNSKFGISPIIKNQAASITNEGIDVDFFTIKGKGIKGYLKNIKPLRQHIKKNNYDVVHAHYSLTAFVASLAGAKSLVVSLMGSDVKAATWYKFIVKFFNILFSWKALIVKSQDMYNDLGIKSAIILPNGVDTEKFKPMDKVQCQKQLHWDTSKTHIVFPANPNRREKNYSLALESVKALNDDNIELHYFDNTPNDETPLWYNAANVVLLTSLWEGSPNAIKEAIACCRPIVVTNVGDVSYLLSGLNGTYVIEHNAQEIKESISNALKFNQIEGERQITNLQLSSMLIANQLLSIYNNKF